jgi:hypothetical protein
MYTLHILLQLLHIHCSLFDNGIENATQDFNCLLQHSTMFRRNIPLKHWFLQEAQNVTTQKMAFLVC